MNYYFVRVKNGYVIRDFVVSAVAPEWAKKEVFIKLESEFSDKDISVSTIQENCSGTSGILFYAMLDLREFDNVTLHKS
jgi:hypothetical protein